MTGRLSAEVGRGFEVHGSLLFAAMERSGFLERIGRDNLFDGVDAALERARNLISDGDAAGPES